MIEVSGEDVVRRGAASVRLLADSLRICECSLLTGRAGAGGLKCLRRVHVEADDALSSLLGGLNVHVDIGERSWNQNAGLNVHRDADGACRKWEIQSLHGDLADTHWKAADNVLGAIAGAGRELRSQCGHSGRELRRSHGLIGSSCASDPLSGTGLDG